MTLEEKITNAGASVAKYAVPLVAGGLTLYSFLNHVPVHDYNHRTAILGTHVPHAALTVAGTIAVGKFTLPLLKKGLGLVNRFAEWSAEKIGAAKQTGQLVSRLGLLSLAGYAAAAIAGAAGVAPKSDYNLLNKPAEALVDYVSNPSKEFWRNITYLRMIFDPTRRIPTPPDNLSDFPDWHMKTYGCSQQETRDKNQYPPAGTFIDEWNPIGMANGKTVYLFQRMENVSAGIYIARVGGIAYAGKIYGLKLPASADFWGESSRLHAIDDRLLNIYESAATRKTFQTPEGPKQEDVRTVTLYDLAQEEPVSIGAPIEDGMASGLKYVDTLPNTPVSPIHRQTLVFEFTKLENGKLNWYHRNLQTGEDTLVETEGSK